MENVGACNGFLLEIMAVPVSRLLPAKNKSWYTEIRSTETKIVLIINRTLAVFGEDFKTVCCL